MPRWVPRAGTTAHGVPGGQWLVFADTEVGVELGRGLDGGVRVHPPGILDGDLDAQLVAELGDVQRVLFAPAVTGAAIDVAEAYRLFHAVKKLTAALVSGGTPVRLFILTRNAQPVIDGDRANPVHAVLWGLGRSIALEHPEIWGGLIDLDESVPAVLAARWVLAEADAHDGEDQVVYRAGVRHVPRLQRHTPQSPTAGVVLDPDSSQLVIGASGKIGPHLITQLARMGARTIVAVSRHGGGLDQCRQQLPAGEMTLIEVTADAADPAAMTALFDRFGADLPALEGIYLAAYAGAPVTLGRNDRRRCHRDVSPQTRCRDTAAHVVAAHPSTPLRVVLLDLGATGVTLDRPLHRHQHLPGHPGSRPPQPRVTGHRHQLGTVGVTDRYPNPDPPQSPHKPAW